MQRLLVIPFLVAGCGGATTSLAPNTTPSLTDPAAPSPTATPTVATASSARATSAATTTPAGGGTDYTAVGFSVGGNECTLGDAARTFMVGVPIHTVLNWSPSLPTGGTVTVTVEKDGVELVEARQTITV